MIPESLYLWRLKHLEQALRQRANDPTDLQVVAYCCVSEEEDEALQDYPATLVEYSPAEEEGDEHLNKSGFERLLIEWESGGNEDRSPWEISVAAEAYKAPSPPTLSPDEKQSVANSIRSIESNDLIR